VLQPNSLTTVCGTETFVTPEIIEHNLQYDVECDVWSLGVVFLMVLGGYRPFRGEGEDCLEKIRYETCHRTHISDDATIQNRCVRARVHHESEKIHVLLGTKSNKN
jgi:serine/threonine protein kinase